MLLSRDFKMIAKENLRGRWRLGVGTGLVAGLLGAAIRNNLSFDLTSYGDDAAALSDTEYDNVIQQAEAFLESDLFQAILPALTGILIVLCIYLLIVLIIGGAVTLGYAQFNLNLTDDNDPRFSDLFSHMRRKWEGFCMQFFRGMMILLWSMLFVIPGIIASYRYAMTPYILAENYDLSMMEAISESKRLMRGNKWKLFTLDVSFIGWILLSDFTLGIASLWVNPYQEAARAAFYREISEQRYSRPHVETEWTQSSDNPSY
ncbi:MAG: DUF975 family protein [Lachnospiraceae bacterium]|nr:DUF975 family protein [Lachnospiraceae bacterium]